MDSIIKYKPVGYCIYCQRKAVTLSDEHIIAEAIGGNYILPKASCKRCSKETTKLEGHCFRATLHAFRLQNDFGKRRKNEKPKQFPLTAIGLDGQLKIDNISIQNYPAFLVLPHVKTIPTILVGDPPVPPTTLDAWGRVSNNQLLSENYKGYKIGYVPFHPEKWLRMIAKIAHSYATAEMGNSFNPLLTKLIRGHDKATTDYIGSIGESLPAAENILHRIHLNRVVANHSQTEFLVANLRLFANYGAPQYDVVVGQL